MLTPEPENPPTPIAQLMARDPLLLASQDITAIIAELRKQRTQYVATDDKKVGTPAARKSKAQKTREEIGAIASQLDLDKLLGL